MRFSCFIKWPHPVQGLSGNCASLAGSILCRLNHVVCPGSSVFYGRNKKNAEKNKDARNVLSVTFLANVFNASFSQKLCGVNDNFRLNTLTYHPAVAGHPLSGQSYVKRPYSDISSRTQPSHSTQRQQKTAKQSVKEFNFKGKISDHDLNVKLSKIKGLLEKGKMVQVFLRTVSSGESKSDAMSVVKFQQNVIDFMGPLVKLHKDFSNDEVTRFTLKPIIKKEIDALDKNQNNDNETL